MGCYMEEGSTTTPFDMLLRNGVSRYDVMVKALEGGARGNEKVALDLNTLLGEVRAEVSRTRKLIMDKGVDPEGTFDVPTFEGTVFGKEEGGGDGEGKSKEDGFFVN